MIPTEDWNTVVSYIYEQALIANSLGIDAVSFPAWLKKQQWDARKDGVSN